MAEKRVGDLEPGDLTPHMGGGCSCGAWASPWRVEKIDHWGVGDGADITWSHPPCGAVAEPLACGTDGFIPFFGRA